MSHFEGVIFLFISISEFSAQFLNRRYDRPMSARGDLSHWYRTMGILYSALSPAAKMECEREDMRRPHIYLGGVSYDCSCWLLELTFRSTFRRSKVILSISL